MRKFSFITAFALALLVISTGAAMAQFETVGAIEGVIKDADGAALPGVTVEAKGKLGTLSTTTDETGKYRFPRVPPGDYVVSATLEGFKTAQSQSVNVQVGRTSAITLNLEVGAIEETIEVLAEAAQLDFTQSGRAVTVNSEMMNVIPRGRDFSDVVTQAGGVANEQDAAGLAVDGASGLENRFIVDGMDTTDPQSGGQAKAIVADFLEEVSVKSAGYQAEHGGAVGGVIQAVTKSGTNDFNGSVGLRYEDSSWDGDERPTLQFQPNGRDAESPVFHKDERTRIEPHFTLGGPIARDKAWFWIGYQPSFQETDRTVDFTGGRGTSTFGSDFDIHYISANITGNAGSQLLYKVAANLNPSKTEKSLPGKNGRGSSDPAIYLNGVDNTNEAFSGSLDYVPSSNFFLSGRAGQWTIDAEDTNVPFNPLVKQFTIGSCTVFGLPASQCPAAGFQSAPVVNARKANEYIRTTAGIDSNFFFTAGGDHQVKIGGAFEQVENHVDQHWNNGSFLQFAWNTGDRIFGEGQGKYGAVSVYTIETSGDVKVKNYGLYVQDSWSVLPNLTINLGVRAEEEKVPDYSVGGSGDAIHFDWDEKLAPRIGFAWDVQNNQKYKAYASWGRYFDIIKYDLPRGSFGGDKWQYRVFALNTLDWANVSCGPSINDPAVIPTCTAGLDYQFQVDLRASSVDYIDPDLQPFESEEWQAGLDVQASENWVLGARFVHKEVVKAIEDIGNFVCNGATCAESYAIGNPGYGVSTIGFINSSGTVFPMPKAVRDYDAIELKADRRLRDNWMLRVSYRYSELTGNYTGLASGDENGRATPNVNRVWDHWHNLFDENSRPVEGDLPTDRPHSAKIQAVYQLPIGTSFGLNQTFASGTPVSTQAFKAGVFFMPYGRGDLGRTDDVTQTDLLITHPFKFGDYELETYVNVINVFDEDTELDRIESIHQGSLSLTDDAFSRGFNTAALIASQRRTPDGRYNRSSEFQAPRAVRLGATFRF